MIEGKHKLEVYLIFDKKIAIYLTPVLVVNHEYDAIRIFGNMLCDINTNIGKYPDEYDLYQSGYFQQVQGKFLEDQIRHVINGESLVREMALKRKRMKEGYENAKRAEK